MSRRLLATRMAQLNPPIPTPVSRAGVDTRPTWTYAVPQTATSPKKTNTKISPSPA